jgi:hypothetical protein
MHAKTLQRLIDDGEFPQPLKLSPGTLVWSWRDVLYWSLRAEIAARMVAEPDRKERKPRRKMKDNEGQTTPSSGQLPGTH